MYLILFSNNSFYNFVQELVKLLCFLFRAEALLFNPHWLSEEMFFLFFLLSSKAMPIDWLLWSIKKLYFEDREFAYLHMESLATEKLC